MWHRERWPLMQMVPLIAHLMFCSWAVAFCTPARPHAVMGPVCARIRCSPLRNEGNEATTLHSLQKEWGGLLFQIGSQWCSQVTRTILSTCLCLFFAFAVVSVTRFIVTFRDTFSLLSSSISLFKRLLFRLIFLRVECAQQAFEALFILLRVGPFLEVANVPGALDILCPWLGAVQDSPVYTDRIQHIWYILRFLVQCSFHFIGHPTAINRVLRQDQQQFIVQSDRLINTMFDFIPDVHIFWREPAAHAFLLQVIVQPSGKQLILARIADETGVVFDGLVCQSRYDLNEGILNSRSTKKDLWYLSVRFIDGVNSDGRGALVLYCFKTICCTQIQITECSKSYYGIAEANSFEIGLEEISTLEVCRVEVGISEIGAEEVGTSEVCVAEIGLKEIDNSEIGLEEISTFEVGVAEIGSVEIGFVEVGLAEIGSAEVGSDELGVAEVGVAKVDAVETGIAEVGVAEVNLFVWMHFSPYIPCAYFLAKHVNLFLYCHVVVLLHGASIIEKRTRLSKNKKRFFPLIADGYSLSY